MHTINLIKAPKINPLMRIKSRSTIFQITSDLFSFLEHVKSARLSGTVRVYCWLGGINGVEFEESHRVTPVEEVKSHPVE